LLKNIWQKDKFFIVSIFNQAFPPGKLDFLYSIFPDRDLVFRKMIILFGIKQFRFPHEFNLISQYQIINFI